MRASAPFQDSHGSGCHHLRPSRDPQNCRSISSNGPENTNTGKMRSSVVYPRKKPPSSGRSFFTRQIPPTR